MWCTNHSVEECIQNLHSNTIFLTVILLKNTTEDSAIGLLMKFAGFTYGPLIGMFFFGILSKRKMKDVIIPFVCLFSILSTIALWYFSAGAPGGEEVFLTDRAGKVQLGIFGEYKFGFEIILMNALITFGSLFLLSSKDDSLSAGVTKIKNS